MFAYKNLIKIIFITTLISAQKYSICKGLNLDLKIINSLIIKDKHDIILISGAMGAGKTKTLIEIAKNLEADKFNFIIIKPNLDQRILNLCAADPKKNIISRAGTHYNCFSIESFENLANYLEKNSDIKLILIDEAQFFEKNELLEFIQKYSKNNYKFIISGLDLDFKSETFGIMGDLSCLADYIIKLKTYCKICGKKKFCISQRIINGKPAKKTDPLILIGADEYEARCRICHEVG